MSRLRCGALVALWAAACNFEVPAPYGAGTGGGKAGGADAGAGKVVAPSLQTRICDRAMQTFGAMGLSPDAPVADLWTWGRVLRIADGPDEVHLASVAKQEIRVQSQNRAAASRYF